MKHTSKISHTQNATTTINTLRAHAKEMLTVADYLEATQKFTGNGAMQAGRARSPGRRRLSAVGKRKIIAANQARTAKKKDVQVIGKAA